MKGGIQMALSAVAICVSIAAVFYSTSVAKQIASSEFQAAQQAKSDTAKLLSSLASMGEKWALERQRPGEDDRYDISLEQKMISDFINSNSASALRAWIGENETNHSKDWTPFFLDLQDLSTGNLSDIDPSQIAGTLSLLRSLERTDVMDVIQNNLNLVEVISSSKSTKYSPIIQAILEMYEPIDREEAIGLLEWLKEDGVNDVNVDMWWAVLASDADVDALRLALKNGADPNMPLTVVIDKYCDILEEAGYTLKRQYKRSCEAKHQGG